MKPALRWMALFMTAAIAACTTIKPVQPWQKGVLSKTEMRLSGDPLEQAFDEHIYASREGAAGGSGANGGGCGCY